jgi:hypothetical protein
MNWDDIETQTRVASSDEFETLDEAVAAALAELAPGGRLDIHEEDCTSEDGSEESCDCSPLILYKGAEA